MLSSLDRSPAVKHLLIINVLVFIVMSYVPQIGKYYGLFTLQYFDKPSFEIWQILTHMFLHGSIMHIAFNMFVLFQFGPVLEQHWGTKKFVFFYFFAGLGASLFYILNQAGIFSIVLNTIYPVSEGLLHPSRIIDAVGASGAISGIVAAFAYLHPNTKLMLMFIPVPVKAKYLIGGFFVYDLVMGLKNSLTSINSDLMQSGSDGIAHWAHLGGAVFGILLLFYWQKNSRTFY